MKKALLIFGLVALVVLAAATVATAAFAYTYVQNAFVQPTQHNASVNTSGAVELVPDSSTVPAYDDAIQNDDSSLGAPSFIANSGHHCDGDHGASAANADNSY